MKKLIILFVSIFQISVYGIDTIVLSRNAPNVISSQDGFDVDLIRSIYATNGESYRLVESDSLADFFGSVSRGNIGAGGISITESREESYDFVPYMDSGLKAVTLSHGENTNIVKRLLQFRYFKNLWEILQRIEVIEMGFSFVLVTLLFAHVVWFFERKSNKIPDEYFAGIRSSIYFCIITQSTVGYGDITVKNRLSVFSVIVMIFSGISMFSNFTSLLAADLVTDRLEHEIRSMDDLKGKTVAVKRDSFSHLLASRFGAICIEEDSMEDCIAALSGKQAEVALGDASFIDYYCKSSQYSIAPSLFNPHEYGFAFPEGDARKEKFTRAILRLRESGELQEIYNKWF